GETAKLALRSLRLQKFRALLTALGIVIGVAAVIAMLSISEGAKREALEQVRLMGVNNLRVRSVKPLLNERKKQDQAESGGWISRYGVTPSELAHLRVLSPEIAEIVPLREVRKDVWARDIKTDIRVVGTSPSLVDVLDYRPESGRFITTLDERQARSVCVL